MRSVVVVLPASMCAMMPMLRVRLSEYPLLVFILGKLYILLKANHQCFRLGYLYKKKEPHTKAEQLPRELEPEVSKRFVCLSHTVRIILLLNRPTFTIGRTHQLFCQTHRHAFIAARSGVLNNPTKR